MLSHTQSLLASIPVIVVCVCVHACVWACVCVCVRACHNYPSSIHMQSLLAKSYANHTQFIPEQLQYRCSDWTMLCTCIYSDVMVGDYVLSTGRVTDSGPGLHSD